MWRPASFAVLTVPLFVPQARAQAQAGDSLPAFRLSYRYASVGVASAPALAPGGRLGLRIGAVAVASAWARRVQDALPPVDLAHPPAPVAPVALGAAPAEQGPTAFRAAGATGVLGQFASLGMDLSLRFELKADQFRNLKCNAIERLQAISGCTAGFPTITPNPQYAIRSGGVVGQRLHVNVDFDSQREFDANNNLQVWYEGLEDEVLKRVEAGNVTFQVPSSRFISAAIPANNFGIQTVTQIGDLEMRAIYAQQKGNVVRDRTYTVGATTTQPIDRQFRELDYEQGRFFFAVDPFAIPGYPAVDILSIIPGLLPDSLRVGSLNVYRVRAVVTSSGTNQNIGGIRAVACGPGTTRSIDCFAERAGPFQWELLQAGKDYYVDPSGAWFALASRLDPNDYLAVSYQPLGVTDCRTGRCVGTFPQSAPPDTTTVDTLRLVYDPRPGVTANSPAFRFEIRSAYRLGGHELSRETVALVLSVNQRQRPLGAADTYLARLGIALATDPSTFDEYNRLFPRDRDPQGGLPIRDYYVVFPHLQPFADPTKLVPAERNDSLYRTPRNLLATQGPPSIFTLALHADASAAQDRGTLSLSTFQIREGSEKLYLGDRLLARDVDYSIDYTVGLVTFTNPDSLFASGTGTIRAQFEERAQFASAATSIYGVSAKYGLGDVGQLYFTGLFQKQQTVYTRPQLGSEPSSGFIGGVSTTLHFEPSWLTQLVRAIPGPKSDAKSFITASGEIAVTRPQPNPLGQAYIEEFEGQAGRPIPLAETAWHWGSVPSSSRGATQFGISPIGFDTVDAVPLTWQSLPLDFQGRPVQFLPTQIDPTIRVVGQAQSAEPVLWLMLKPDTMMGLADSRTGIPNWRRPGSGNNAGTPYRWRSITQSLSTTGLDLSRVEYLEFWVWEDNTRSAMANRAAVVFDFGSIFEDALAFVPETVFVSPQGDTTYSGVRLAGKGRLDTEREPLTHAWNAVTDDEGILTDRITDGIVNGNTGQVIDTLPLCSATVDGQLVSYAFGDPRSRCGRHNGAVDDEDLDGDEALDVNVGARSEEDFFRFVFPIGDERYYVRDGGMVAAPAGQGGGSSGWRLYRIPFRTDTLQIGTPNIRQVQSLRVTILAPETALPGQPDPQIFFGLSRVNLVGATWLKRAETPIAGIAGEQGTGVGDVNASIVSTQNVDLGYTPPPGVIDEAAQQGQGLQLATTQINEQSMRLLATGLSLGQRAEAFTRFATEGDKNFLKYRKLRAWARGRGPGWEDGDLEFYLKVGKDADNFYLYHTPARTSSWEPEVVMDMDQWMTLRARIEQAWLGGEAPHVYPGCPDSTIVLPNDSAYVMCAGPYIAHIRDPGNSPPNLAAVQEIAAGMLRVHATTVIDQAELWVDDIRLSDVVQNTGTAAALNLAVTAGDLADITVDASRRDPNFHQLGEDPTYQTSNALNLATTVHLERLLPRSWGLAAPFAVRYSFLGSTPVFLEGTDLRGDALTGLRTPQSTARSYLLSVRRSHRARSGLAHWLADPLGVTLSYLTGDDRASLTEATSSAYSVDVDYGLQPGNASIRAVPEFLVRLVRKLPPFIGKSAFADGLDRARLRYSPVVFRLRSTVSGSDASFNTFRVMVADSGDAHLIPARTQSRAWRNSATIDLAPLTGSELRLDLASQRDLRDYGDSTTLARVASLSRKSLLGVDVGFERQRTIASFLGITPQLVRWLRPRASLTSSFSLTRDPNGATPTRSLGDSAGAFHLPTAYSNAQHADLGTQVDLARLGQGLFGDSTWIARWLARVTSLDIGVSRDRSSSYSGSAQTPSFSYQLALAGFDAFRAQGGDLATSALQSTTGHATVATSLPFGFRIVGNYLRTQSVTWLMRIDDQVEIASWSREWPSGAITWTITPSPKNLGRLLTGVTVQLGVRDRQTATQQPTLTGLESSSTQTTERSIAPSATLSWIRGILTSVDLSRLTSENTTAGNLFKSVHSQGNANVSFAWRPPRAILNLKSNIRTTARYSYSLNTSCLLSAGTETCVPYVDSRQTNVQLTLDTSFPPSLSAGLQMAYLLDDERQINRKISQLTLTAFVQLNTNVGQIR